MNSFFIIQNSSLLWFLPLIGIPIIIHLLARAKPPLYLFATTRLIKKVVHETIRLKRPKDRLLLICRTLLFAVLLLVFLRPILFNKSIPISQDSPRNVVIVVDRSASMAWSEGGQSRFKVACDEAAAILDTLSSVDIANVVWLDKNPDGIFAEMGTNIPYLRQRLKETRVSNESGNSSIAIGQALTQLKTGKGLSELYIISDFQASQWKDLKITVPDNIKVSIIWPVKEKAANGSILSLRINPVSPLIGEPSEVILSIANYSDIPRNRTVTIKISERLITRQVQIPAWGQATVAVGHIFSTQGQIAVSGRLDEDSFGADDWRGIMVPVRKAMKVGFIGDDPTIAPVWRRALYALPWVEVVEIKNHPVDAMQFDLLMLAGWDGSHIDSISSFKKNRIPVIFSPAAGLSSKRISFITDKSNLVSTQFVAMENLAPSMGLKIQDMNHRVLSLFRDGSFGDPALAAFHKRLQMANIGTYGEVVLSYLDGEPALVQSGTTSRVIIWLAPLSTECSDWPNQVVFLPFFGELINFVRADSNAVISPLIMAGETLNFEKSAWSDDFKIFDSRDNEIKLTEIQVGKVRRLVSEPISKPGIYKLCSGDDCSALKTVNFPVVESDLRVNPPPVISKGESQTVQYAAELNSSQEGRQLWQVLVWTALGLICIESVLVLLLGIEDRKMADDLP